MPPEKIKKTLRFIWVCFLLGCIFFYVRYAHQLTKENLAGFMMQYREGMLLTYFLICIFRGLMLIPATPFLFAGIMLFNQTPVLLLTVFLASIFVVSTLIYYTSGYLGFAQYFERSYPVKTAKLKSRLNSPSGSWFLFFWALAPFTPTDLACYTAGALRIRFIRFIVPLLLGEAVICTIYIFAAYCYSDSYIILMHDRNVPFNYYELFYW